jgi:hypothetical protein
MKRHTSKKHFSNNHFSKNHYGVLSGKKNKRDCKTIGLSHSLGFSIRTVSPFNAISDSEKSDSVVSPDIGG